jgi:hypothetical protein
MRYDTIGEQDETGAVCQCKVEIVRNCDAQLACFCLLLKHGEAVKLLLDVEKSRRFIKEEDRSILRETCRQENALPLASAQRSKGTTAIIPAVSSSHRLLNEDVIFV